MYYVRNGNESTTTKSLEEAEKIYKQWSAFSSNNVLLCKLLKITKTEHVKKEETYE